MKELEKITKELESQGKKIDNVQPAASLQTKRDSDVKRDEDE